ncbi:MAG: YdeI/OmpD-associated family protein [Actinomycetota bacterium]|nr:YdeI/OmpD-associated family protein [Actinomycetota bacterium]
MVTVKPELPILPFASREAWEVWLAEEHATSDGLWLKIAKKGSGIETVTFAEALDVALCYGWIDSQRAGFDGRYFLQRLTPRKPRSTWSQVNREKVAGLIEAGRVKPAGLREVERAKADGRWDAAYEPQSAATVPDDLRLELEGNEGAREFFETLDKANRYAILFRIQDAKKPETRARRIAKYIEMLAEGKKLHP